jgi:Flp pilus assembly protein TadD
MKSNSVDDVRDVIPGADDTRLQWWQQDWFISILLVIVTVIAYMPAWNGTPIWDDDRHIPPTSLRSLAGLARVWTRPGTTDQYYPVMFTVLWVEVHLWGNSMLGFHLVNILLHAFSAVLLMRILRKLRVPGSPLAAALFALHPVQVESVAWISEIKNTLSGLFCFGAALVYFQFDQKRRWSLYFAALVLFILALLSKTVVATLPAVLLVVFWWKRRNLSWKRDVLPLIPFFGLAAALGILSAWLEKNVVGASGADYNFSFIERTLIAGRSTWFYLEKLVWPNPLMFMYPRWQVSQTIWWQYFFPFTALALFGALWRLRNRWPAPLTAFLLFVGILFPALGFVNVYPFRFSFVADHFQYLACIGPLSLAASAITIAFGLLKESVAAIAKPLFVGLLLTVLSVMTWQQSSMYSGMETLWATTVQQNPKSFMAQYNYGLYLNEHGRWDEAQLRLQDAVALDPGDAGAQNNLGFAYIRQGRTYEAVDHFQKAAELQPANPGFHANLGTALNAIGRHREAAIQLEEALRVSPSEINVANNLAWLLATCPDSSVRNGSKAVDLAQRAIRLSGGNHATYYGTLSVAFAEAGQFDQAIDAGQKAVSLAVAENNKPLEDRYRNLIELFQSHRPYHEE